MQPQPSFKLEMACRPVGQLLLTSAALQLLSSGSCSLGLTPTLSPPQNMIINGERKTLVLCLANALSEDALSAVWFSSGNGSVLEPSNYGAFQEEDGTFSAISHISISTQEFELWDTITCYVAPNQTSRNWSASSLQIAEENGDDPCLDESQGDLDQTFSLDIQRTHFQILLLLAARMLLFKILLSDVLMTCCLIYKSETYSHRREHDLKANNPQNMKGDDKRMDHNASEDLE